MPYIFSTTRTHIGFCLPIKPRLLMDRSAACMHSSKAEQHCCACQKACHTSWTATSDSLDWKRTPASSDVASWTGSIAAAASTELESGQTQPGDAAAAFQPASAAAAVAAVDAAFVAAPVAASVAAAAPAAACEAAVAAAVVAAVAS